MRVIPSPKSPKQNTPEVTPLPLKVKDIVACNDCPMQRLHPEETFVAPAINDGTRLVIGEAPGELESVLGEPLVGPSGAWLRGRYDEDKREWRGGLFAKANIRDKEVSRANCLQCRPPDNQFPTDPEARAWISREDAERSIQHCLEAHLLPLLRSRAWTRIDLLGDKALRIVGGKDGGIQRWRGSPIPIPAIGDRLLAVPTFHPSYLARDQRFIPIVVQDLKKNLVIPQENYSPHPSLEQVKDFNATHFAFDIETDRATDQIICVGLCSERGSAICVPFRGEYLTELRRIFAEADELVGHNSLQFDLPRLREQGCPSNANSTLWDTMLLQHLLQPDLPHDLGFLGSIFTNKPAWKHESGDDLELYCCRDTDATWQCFLQLRALCKAEGLLPVYERISRPMASICLGMFQLGIQVDPTRIGVVRDKLLAESAQIELKLPDNLKTFQRAIKKRAPAPPGTLGKSGKPVKFILLDAEETIVPWRSPDALGAWLYDQLGLPEQLHAKSAKRTSDKTALAKLESRLTKGTLRKTTRGEVLLNGSELAGYLRAVQKLRKLDELLTTFVKGDMLKVERVWPHFNVHGTSSGRLSSSDPNLQNIPPSARYVYTPSHPTWRFLEADYSQLENRLTAWFARDAARQERLSQPGFSEHKWLASEFFGIPIDEVLKDSDKDAPYGKAKRIGHGTNYGMGAKKISLLYDMDLAEVKRLLEQWKVLNAVTVAWQLRTTEDAKRTGVLTNPFGRKRWFYTDSYYTESLSFLPQSTGADIIHRAAIGLLYNRLGLDRDWVNEYIPYAQPIPAQCRLVLQVHDSLLFEGPGDQMLELAQTVQQVMEQPWRELAGLAIPIEFKLGQAGDSWGELQPFKLP